MASGYEVFMVLVELPFHYLITICVTQFGFQFMSEQTWKSKLWRENPRAYYPTKPNDEYPHSEILQVPMTLHDLSPTKLQYYDSYF